MVSYKGSTVLSGVTWEYDTKTVTVKMAPASCNSGKSYKKRYTRTWKNYCPYCKKSGKLLPHGTRTITSAGKKRKKKAPEGEITCTGCDVDFDGVSGKSKEGKCKYSLTKASSSSDTATKSESSLNDKKTALAEVKKEYKEKSIPKKDYKLIIPPLKDIKEGDYIELNPPLVSKTQTFFIGAIDTAQDDMQLTLYDKVPSPGSEYKSPDNKTPTTTTSSTSTAAKTIEKKIKLKGKQLKSIAAIYKWLRKDGGSGGWKYKYYLGHKNGENENKFGKNSALWCWNNKTANCVDFAWIFYTMCKGAGIKVNIIQGKAALVGGTYDHMWNKTKSGKIYDCSTTKGNCKKYTAKKKVI